ncbi:putative major facilitator superfamily, MFS transporter superfamily [Helianthus anomalus]
MEPQKFSIAVDSDHKATEFRPLSLSSPHMRAFHLAWLSLFTCFFSTFSIPPLLPIIRQDLNLSPSDVGTAGIAAFAGSIISRLAMGPACDVFGPRLASATLSLATAPILLSAAFISTPLHFILLRFFVGFSLANFVANQFWMSSMFSKCTVGLANGVAAGWANVGSGLTQLVMPFIFSVLNTYFDLTQSVSWRTALVVPAVFQAMMAIMVLAYGQDLPDGSYKNIKNREKNSKDDAIGVFLNGIKNYRGSINRVYYLLYF